MKSKFIKRESTQRLILIFAGWGMDWRPFATLDHPDYDIAVVWDYRELSFSWKPYFRYDEICLIAWSMGVFAASVTIHEISPRITMRIAVNGTLTPIDDRFGIPPAIWHGTLNALAPSTWRKFQRRMCDSADQYAEFSENAPKRTIEELKEELIALETHTIFHVEQITDWDLAIISCHDAIFPPAHQTTAWHGIAPIRELDCGHLPDFSALLRRLIKDKNHVGRCFDKARLSYARGAIVQHEIANDLMKKFDQKRENETAIIGNVIEVGPGVDCYLTHKWLPRTDPRARLRLWDLVDIDTSDFGPNVTFERCDAEVRIRRQPSESVGFIFSASTIQWFNSPRDFLKECERVLVPGGWLAISSFVHGNLAELTSVTGNGLQLLTLNDWRKIIPDGMEVLLMESENYTLSFDSPRAVLEHLRDTGVTGVNYGEEPVVMARRILREYPRDTQTGKYNATYRPIFIIAHKSETQP